MDYFKALAAHELIEELLQNNKDMSMIKDAINNGIVGAQITIKCKDGTYMSTVYENARINLLLQTLYSKNTELMTKIQDL